MTEAVVVALITGSISLVGSIIASFTSHSLTVYRLEQLEKKQDKHNCLIERMYEVEKKVEVIEEKINNLEE